MRCVSRWELLQQIHSGGPSDAVLFSQNTEPPSPAKKRHFFSLRAFPNREPSKSGQHSSCPIIEPSFSPRVYPRVGMLYVCSRPLASVLGGHTQFDFIAPAIQHTNFHSCPRLLIQPSDTIASCAKEKKQFFTNQKSAACCFRHEPDMMQFSLPQMPTS